MLLEAKILNPVRIKLGKNSNFVMSDEVNKENCPINQGIMFSGHHYGFILIIDYNGKQREISYPTQCRIDAVGLENKHLKVFEEGKKNPWKLDESGKLEHSTYDEFTEEYKRLYHNSFEKYQTVMGKTLLKNPVNIKIARDSANSVILKDDDNKEEYPLFPGAILGTENYGFVLVIDTKKGQKEMVYPTQNRIDAIGIDGNVENDIKIFEEGKYNPWVFTCDGILKSEASYNPYSRRDNEYIKECCNLDEKTSDGFTLQKKKF